MWKSFHKIARVLAVAVLLLLIAGVGAPYLRADYFAARIHAGLEQSLGRKVRIGNARYNVFTGPGFRVEEVTIAEDSRIGIEPFAHVAEVHARVDVWSLFSGQIRFSNLRLVEPTVNFARTIDGQWNFERFLERTSAAQLPPIQIRQGRVNFKFGDRKAVPYFGNVDLDIVPGGGSGLRLVASAEPFRTDRPSTTVGRFHLRTSIQNGVVDGELEGERASLAEIAKLVGARDPGLKGFVAAAIRMKGPLDAVQVTGELKLDDLSGGMILPRTNTGALPVAGTINLKGHAIELHTANSQAGAALPVTVKLQAKEYFADPEWSGEIRFEGFAAPALLEVSKRLGASVPEGFRIEKGSFSGSVRFDNANGMAGDVALAGGTLKLPSGSEFEGAAFNFAVFGQNMDLKVHSAEAEDDESKLQVDGNYDLDARALIIRLQTKGPAGMPIAKTVKLIPESPLLTNFRQGSWKGQIRYDSQHEVSPWSGQVEIVDGVVEVEGLAAPVTVHFGAAFDRGRVAVRALRGVCGKLQFSGDYRYDSPAAGHRLNLVAETLDLAELERVLRPSLARGGFFSKTLRIGSAPVPEWLAQRRVEGTIRFAKVTASAGLPKLEKATAKYRWNGLRGRIEDVKAVAGEDGSFAVDGEISVDLAGNQPRYRSRGKLESPALSVEGSLDTEGLGTSLLTNMVSKGDFHAEKVHFNSDWTFDEVSGAYAASVQANGQPKFAVTALSLTQGTDVYQGQGATQADGKVALELSGSRKQVKLVGSLLLPPSSIPR